MGIQPGRTAAFLLVLCGFILVAYLPSFSVPFVFDDGPNIVFNPLVQPDGWAELTDSLSGPRDRNRPVAKLTFAINYLVGGLDPRGFHVVNVAIHLANAIVLFFLLRTFAQAPGSPGRLAENALAFAFAAALLWAVHPVNTQAVTYIVQRIASLATFFYLLGMLSHAFWRSGYLSGGWAITGFVLAFALGTQTKLIVATLPAAVLLVDMSLYSDRLRRVHWMALLGVVLCMIVFAAIHAGEYWPYLTEPSPQRDFTGLERLMTQGRVIWHYLSLLIWPVADRLQLDYDFGVSRGLLDPPTTLAAIVGLALVTLVALLNLRRWTWPALGWLFFLLALSVESSIIPLEMVFEHRLYLPSTILIAGVLAAAFAAPSVAKRRSNLSLGVLVLAGVLSWQAIERNKQWQNLGSFWASDLERGASLYRAALNGGIAFLRAGNSERALELFELIEAEEAAEKDRERGKVAQLKGEAHFRRGEIEPALLEFRRALEFRPEWTRSAYFAAMSLIQLGRLGDARNVLQQMREHHHDSVFTASLEAELLSVSESRQKAIEYLNLQLDPSTGLKPLNRSFLNLHLANMYRDQGNWAAAQDHYRLALEENPENWAAKAGLKIARKRLGQK